MDLAWPNEGEAEAITKFRNRRGVRKWFLDSRAVEQTASQKWLVTQPERPQSALLSIRWKRSGEIVGTIGWSDWDLSLREANFGRIMSLPRQIRRTIADYPQEYCGPILDAALMARDFAFDVMGLLKIRTFVLEDNVLALRINERLGLQVVGQEVRSRPCGETVMTRVLELSRQQWVTNGAAVGQLRLC